MTKIAAIEPGGDCPLWRAFLDRVTGGDTELQAFLQRLFGYALTGSTREHALAFFYGPGGNGKSVLLNTVSSILGDYAKTAGVETFTASSWDRHPTDIASLRGARLVTAIETEEGRQWAEARIKALTGGDRISARFMRQDPFEFTPQFKLVIAGNHKPSLRNVDEAMRRRFHLVPFTVTIPSAERDPDLSEKLKAEWGGILRWMIEGCVQWQKIGLQPPSAVLAATEDYFQEEDSLANWLAERCITGAELTARSFDLFQSWTNWAADQGEEPGNNKRFSTALRSKGFEKIKTKTGAKFLGLALV